MLSIYYDYNTIVNCLEVIFKKILYVVFSVLLVLTNFSNTHDLIFLYLLLTRELKTTHSHLMPLQHHLYNGLPGGRVHVGI